VSGVGGGGQGGLGAGCRGWEERWGVHRCRGARPCEVKVGGYELEQVRERAEELVELPREVGAEGDLMAPGGSRLVADVVGRGCLRGAGGKRPAG
jgi:hypothetical protein